MTIKVYAYGVIDSNEKIDETMRGLNDAPLFNIPYRDIGIVVSDLNAQIQKEDKTSVLKHEEVVEKLMDKFTILPMRFLTLFSGKEQILLMMKDYYDDFIENLDKLREKIEFGVKTIWPGDLIKERITAAHRKSDNLPLVASSSGKSFMNEKFENYKIDKEFEEEADRCIAIVDGFFSKFISEKRLEKLKTDNLLLSASYLVDNEKRDDFKKAFEELRGSGGDLKYLLSGPWPPYNFIILSHSGDGKFGGMDLDETVLQHKDREEKDGK
ncbi:MAG: GvpL/GvpF family gas vesicle protein [Candidatus Omnitrophota bacterium]|nr:GvpL/GvpF family gas vesicle protein [Candidatus Omnitrophota bacterium]